MLKQASMDVEGFGAQGALEVLLRLVTLHMDLQGGLLGKAPVTV